MLFLLKLGFICFVPGLDKNITPGLSQCLFYVTNRIQNFFNENYQK